MFNSWSSIFSVCNLHNLLIHFWNFHFQKLLVTKKTNFYSFSLICGSYNKSTVRIILHLCDVYFDVFTKFVMHSSSTYFVANFVSLYLIFFKSKVIIASGHQIRKIEKLILKKCKRYLRFFSLYDFRWHPTTAELRFFRTLLKFNLHQYFLQFLLQPFVWDSQWDSFSFFQPRL